MLFEEKYTLPLLSTTRVGYEGSLVYEAGGVPMHLAVVVEPEVDAAAVGRLPGGELLYSTEPTLYQMQVSSDDGGIPGYSYDWSPRYCRFPPSTPPHPTPMPTCSLSLSCKPPCLQVSCFLA